MNSLLFQLQSQRSSASVFLPELNWKRKIFIVSCISFRFNLSAENEEESQHGFITFQWKQGRRVKLHGPVIATNTGTTDYFCKNDYFSYAVPHNLTAQADFSFYTEHTSSGSKSALAVSAWKYFKLGTQTPCSFAAGQKAEHWHKGSCKFWKRCWK